MNDDLIEEAFKDSGVRILRYNRTDRIILMVIAVVVVGNLVISSLIIGGAL